MADPCKRCGGGGGCQHCICTLDGRECCWCGNDPADDKCRECGRYRAQGGEGKSDG